MGVGVRVGTGVGADVGVSLVWLCGTVWSRACESPCMCTRGCEGAGKGSRGKAALQSKVLAAVARGDSLSARSIRVAECAARIIAVNSGAGSSG